MIKSAASKVMWVGKVPVFLGGFAVILALWLALMANPAEAAFPGKNGKIFFQSDRDGNPHIYSINPNGTDLSRLTFTSANTDPAVSPDGTKIAFIGGSTTNTSYEVFVMNSDGSGRRQVTNTSVAEQQPTWSPDGTRIAFVANDEILVMNADGTGQTQLTNNAFPDTQPAWSPDGSRIAFVSARTGDNNRNVYVMNADGTGQASITPDSPTGCSSNCYQGHDDAPTWSPDGTKIAYVHGYGPPTNPFAGGGLPNIWTMDPNGGNKTNVSNDSDTSSSQPAWSPDGSKITYVGAVDTNRDIYVMNADGSAQTSIDTNPKHDINPDWQVDTVAPKGTVKINGGAVYTKSATVQLSLSATDPAPGSGIAYMRLKNDGGSWSGWMSYATSKSWALKKANGTRAVYVQYRDRAGNLSTAAVDTIKLDMVKPTVSGMTPRHTSIIRDTTPTIKATVRDNMTNLRKANIKLYVNGKLISATKYSYSAATDVLTYNSPRLSKGKKVVKIVATDAAKNVGARSWYFTIK